MNSSQILRDFDEHLNAVNPEVVLLKIDANDFWTVLVPVDDDTGWSLASFVKQHSRLYKLLYMATRDTDEVASVVENVEHKSMQATTAKLQYGNYEFHVGHKQATDGDPDAAHDLVQNLTALTIMADKADVKIVFLN